MAQIEWTLDINNEAGWSVVPCLEVQINFGFTRDLGSWIIDPQSISLAAYGYKPNDQGRVETSWQAVPDWLEEKLIDLVRAEIDKKGNLHDIMFEQFS